MMTKTGIVKDGRYLRHMSGFAHPESPQRLAAIYEMLENPLMSWKFINIDPREAIFDEITLIHSPSYLKYIASTDGKEFVFLDGDTATSPESYMVAKLAVGGVLNAIDSVVSGEVSNAFALVRPPGHHAGRDAASGFCIFNNVAIGAMHAIKKHKMEKILIVDWDLHHGNGTQNIFYNDPRVLYFSTHQYPYYPGTGGLNEVGQGAGKGYTINVPLSGGAGDEDYVKIFRCLLQPIAAAFRPQLVLLSAGFDTYYQDPLGSMRLRPKGFAALARVLLNIASECCASKFVAVLEGGYHIQGTTQSVRAVLEEMLDETVFSEADFCFMEKEAQPGTDLIIRQVARGINPFWHVF